MDCMAIRRISDDYAAASGQVVNFSKFVLCVNKSVSMRRVPIWLLLWELIWCVGKNTVNATEMRLKMV